VQSLALALYMVALLASLKLIAAMVVNTPNADSELEDGHIILSFLVTHKNFCIKNLKKYFDIKIKMHSNSNSIILIQGVPEKPHKA